MTRPGLWDRLLWGVSFFSGDRRNRPLLLGRAWLDVHAIAYPNEPTRTLVFHTRKEARAWCDRQHAKYRGRTDCCKDWRFRPVRVRERVEVV